MEGSLIERSSTVRSLSVEIKPSDLPSGKKRTNSEDSEDSKSSDDSEDSEDSKSLGDGVSPGMRTTAPTPKFRKSPPIKFFRRCGKQGIIGLSDEPAIFTSELYQKPNSRSQP